MPFTFSLSRPVTLGIPPFVHLSPRSPSPSDDLLACERIEITREIYEFRAFDFVEFEKKEKGILRFADEWQVLAKKFSIVSIVKS